MALIRLVRRRSAWDEADPAVLASVEFRRGDGTPDLTPSVYEVETGAWTRVVQIHAEHAASLISPPRGAEDVSVDGAATANARRTPGRTLFRFANGQHRELVFKDASQLIAFLDLLIAERSQRCHRVHRDELLTYIANRLDEGDAEWASALDGDVAPRSRDWRDELTRWRKRPRVSGTRGGT